MKLIYIANARIPTEKAHGIQIMKMCEAFANAGINVELVVPKRKNPLKEDPFLYYDIKKNFKIKKVFCFDWVGLGRFGLFAQSISFAKMAFFYSVFKKADIVYSRDELTCLFLGFFKKNVVFEMHGILKRGKFVYDFFLKRMFKIISTNEWKKEKIIKDYQIEEKNILVCPNGVDLEKFDIDIPKEKIREEFELPKNKKIVMYTGHLYGWKGAQVLADASEFLTENEVVVFVGGTEEDVSEFLERNKDKKHIVVLGHKPNNEMPYYVKAADVLVLPNVPDTEESKYETSPIKMFEYMASKRPIIASKMPSIEEILSNENSCLAEPENAQDLAYKIKSVLDDGELSKRISENAYSDVQNYSWKKRAKSIENFIFSRL